MRSHLIAASWSLAAAAVWFVLALNNPTLTYHFAPIIVSGAWPVLLPGRTSRDLWAAGIGAMGMALIVTLALSLSDSLRGPDLLKGDAATAEMILFSVLGAAIAIAFRLLKPAAPAVEKPAKETV